METGTAQAAYGDDALYRAHLLEQYKIYVERLTAEQDKHETTNNFFLTVNTGVVTALALATKGDLGGAGHAVGLVLLPAIAICVVWWLTLRSISQWSGAQLETLQDMEAYLPLKPFTTEWHEKMRGRRGYVRIRTVRQLVPWVFVCVHLALLAAIYRG